MVPPIRPSCSAKATSRCSIGSAVAALDALVVSLFACRVRLSRFVIEIHFCGVQPPNQLSTFRSLPVLLLGYRPTSRQQTCFRIVDHPGIAAQVDHCVLLRRRPSFQALFENRIDATHRSVPLGVAHGRWAAHGGYVLDHVRMLLAQPAELTVVHELITVTGAVHHEETLASASAGVCRAIV